MLETQPSLLAPMMGEGAQTKKCRQVVSRSWKGKEMDLSPGAWRKGHHNFSSMRHISVLTSKTVR